MLIHYILSISSGGVAVVVQVFAVFASILTSAVSAATSVPITDPDKYSTCSSGVFGTNDLVKTVSGGILTIELPNPRTSGAKDLSPELLLALNFLAHQLDKKPQPTGDDIQNYIRLSWGDVRGRETLFSYRREYTISVSEIPLPSSRAFNISVDLIHPFSCSNCFIRLSLYLPDQDWVASCSPIYNLFNVIVRSLITTNAAGGVVVGNPGTGDPESSQSPLRQSPTSPPDPQSAQDPTSSPTPFTTFGTNAESGCNLRSSAHSPITVWILVFLVIAGMLRLRFRES